MVLHTLSASEITTVWRYRNSIIFIIVVVVVVVVYFAHQHKAAGVKTKQNVKQRLQR